MTKLAASKRYGYLLLSISVFLFSACLASEVDEELSVDSVNHALTCEQACGDAYDECEMDCIMDCPDEYCQELCVEECGDDNNTCMYDDYSRTQYGNQNGVGVCHVDIDTHLFSVDIEFYTADSWDDFSCVGNGPTKYKKRYLGKVSCSTWTGLLHPSTCTTRAENKIAQLAGQGYLPNFSDVDIDECPTPRL